MKFFTRCRILSKILTVISVIIGIILAFNVFPIIEDFSLVDSAKNRTLLFFALGLIILLVLVIIVIALNCIIKDAQEDFEAVINMQNNADKNNT